MYFFFLLIFDILNFDKYFTLRYILMFIRYFDF